MTASKKLRMAGISILFKDDETWHGQSCGCRMCILDRPIFNLDELKRKTPLSEVKNRKCLKKLCKKQGCDCQ
jgi:hypothetical protein